MFLIQLHVVANFWRRIGLWTYLAIFLEWLPVAFIIYFWQGTLLYYKISLAAPFLFLGVALVVAGLVLHSWTAKLIGIKATIGYIELKPDAQATQAELITSGPFSVVRHPSYWAHTSIITGIFLVTGVVSLGVIVLIDLGITYFVTTTLEDHELIDRFGDRYKEYQKTTPKFFPKIDKQSQLTAN